jgi:chromosomal replication initiation ATPase DnaA
MAYRIKLEGLDIECDTLEEMWAAKTLAVQCGRVPVVQRDIKPANIVSDMILAAVARCSGVTIAAMAGRVRTRRIVVPRHVACYLLRKIGDMSYMEIGRRFGRDHSTVISAFDSIEVQLAREPDGEAAKLISRTLDALALERAAGIATTITG